MIVYLHRWKHINPNPPPIVLVIISEIVEALSGRNACSTSTVDDKLAQIMKIIASLALTPSLLSCSRPLNPNPKGRNSHMFPIWSLRLLELVSNLLAISLTKKLFSNEKLKGNNVLNRISVKLEIIILRVHLDMNLFKSSRDDLPTILFPFIVCESLDKYYYCIVCRCIQSWFSTIWVKWCSKSSSTTFITANYRSCQAFHLDFIEITNLSSFLVE